jgi:hypothetical protein
MYRVENGPAPQVTLAIRVFGWRYERVSISEGACICFPAAWSRRGAMGGTYIRVYVIKERKNIRVQAARLSAPTAKHSGRCYSSAGVQG